MQLEAARFSRKNENVRPFEPGGETSLEFYCNRNNCPMFVMGSHSKKRPHNLVIGRMFDFHLYDALELGVEEFKAIKDFGAAGTGAQMGNKVRSRGGTRETVACGNGGRWVVAWGKRRRRGRMWLCAMPG